MIATKMLGGLGNQLFQYALAKNISIKHNTEVVIDVSLYENYTLHEYSLTPFNFSQKIMKDAQLAFFRQKERKGIFYFYDGILRKIHQPKIVIEKQFNNSVITDSLKNTYLYGYWQTEKYFWDIKDILLEEFKITVPLAGKNKELANRISNVNAVSLHIRRANYITNKDTFQIHGVCSLDYYDEAMKYIASKVTDPVFFVFSDDFEWVKENLKIPYENVFVDHNDAKTDYEDLRLMNLCNHNIIANSTFSWWGAWLNLNKEKIVIAPKKWFNDITKNTTDIIPSSWICL